MTAPVSQCPCCGAWALPAMSERSALLGVCDVLVRKALEVVGKRLVRVTRSRFNQLGDRPWAVAHTLWAAGPQMIDKALSGAWDIVPALLDSHRADALGVSPEQVTAVLDEYVRTLVARREPHRLSSLRAYLTARLGLVLPREEADAR